MKTSDGKSEGNLIFPSSEDAIVPSPVLMLTVPNHNYPFLWDPINWILERGFKTHIKSGFWAGIWNQHLRLYYLEELRKIVKKAGFRVEKLECLTHYCLPFNHHLLNLGARILVGGILPKSASKSISKFSKGSKKSFFQRILGVLNKFDELNKRVFKQKSTVGILAKAKK